MTEEVTLRGSYSEKKVEAIYNDSEQLYEVQPPLKPEEEVTTVESFREAKKARIEAEQKYFIQDKINEVIGAE